MRIPTIHFFLWWIALCSVLNNVDAVIGKWTSDFQEPYTNLVIGGQVGTAPYPTYVCRAQTEFGTIPGKFVHHDDTCYIALNNKEIQSKDFEVLLKNPRYAWVKGIRGSIGNHAVEGGYTEDGDKLYICRTSRVKVRKLLWSGLARIVGNIGKNEHSCLAPWFGRANAYDNYEVLVQT